MAVFAISDLHLSSANPKPMEIFGAEWKDHHKRIARNWDSEVAAEDVVLIAGDTSWAMRLAEAMPDLDWVAARPGRKFLVRGNHDYWWRREATNRIQRMLGASITLLQGTSAVVDSLGIAGTRGWRLEDYGLEGPAQGDVKVYERELRYLRRALESLPADVGIRIAVLHYPPFDLSLQPNDFRRVLEEFSVDVLVYGHVHKGTGSYLEGDVGGIRYCLAAVDHTRFRPVQVIG